MRILKFRAWDKVDSKIRKVTGISGFNIETRSYVHLLPAVRRHINNVELMQFTGIHDKNGQEIYEGDVLGYQHRNGVITKQEVKWEEWDDIEERGIGFCLSPSYMQESEIIGNIHENPELLK